MSVLGGPREGRSVFEMKVVEELDELRRKLAGEAAHIKSLEGLLVDAADERDEARAAVARLTAQLESITAENHARAQREARSLGDWASLRAEVEALRAALTWYVDNDDTNEGGKWEESNAGWLKGKRAAEKLLGRGGEE